MNRTALLICVIASALMTSAHARAADAPAKRPNILFCIADDASWKHFSAYGCKFCNTPNFDRLAREGILFKNCFTPLPKCSPSRATILTGRYPWQNEEACDHNGLMPGPDKLKLYTDQLESAGYFVGLTGKGWAPGDFKSRGRSRNPAGPSFDKETNKPPTSGISALDYAKNFDDFLKARPKDKPFCFWYGGHEPHRKYQLGSGLKAGKKLEDVEVPPYLPDDKTVRGDILDYALEIEWYDTHLGRMIKALEAIGELDNTIIVSTSDNGMPFPRDKGHIYEDACHMPLAIRWGNGIKGGRVVDDFVSHVDYAPTFMELAGLTPLKEMSGHSLMNLLKSDKSGQIDPTRDHVVLGRERTDTGRPNDVGFPVRGIRTKDFFFTHNFEPDRWPCGNPETGYRDTDDSPSKTDVIELNKQGQTKWYNLSMAKRGADELYDLRKDPSAVENVAGNSDYAKTQQQLWEQVQKELKEQQDPRMFGKGELFDKYEYVGGGKSKESGGEGGKPGKKGKKKGAPAEGE